MGLAAASTDPFVCDAHKSPGVLILVHYYCERILVQAPFAVLKFQLLDSNLTDVLSQGDEKISCELDTTQSLIQRIGPSKKHTEVNNQSGSS